MVERDKRTFHLHPGVVREAVTSAFHDQLTHLSHETALVNDAVFLVLGELQARQCQ